MTDEPDIKSENDIHAIWRDQPKEANTMTLEVIHNRAQLFQARQTREIIVVAICTLLAVIITGYVVAVMPDGMFRLGYALTSLGCLWVLYYAHTNRSRDRKALIAPSQDCIEFYREALLQKLHITRTIWFWAWLPLTPGLILTFYSANKILAHTHNVVPERLAIAQHLVIGMEILMPFALAGLFIRKVWREHKLQHELNRLNP